MGFSKVIVQGTNGSVVFNEEAGIATVKASVSAALGSGDLAGVAKVVASAEVDVSAVALIDAGLLLAEAKFPTAAPLIAALKLAIDAEIAKI